MEKQELANKINELKRQRGAVILAHFYQDDDIQQMADFTGDSLALAQWAARTDAPVLVLCGVHFMGETAKILCPEKTVLVPVADAGCSLADSCDADAFRQFIEAHPGHTVISYVNTSAAVKALTDTVVTSSNARQIVESLPADEPVIFGPDRNLGRYLNRITGRRMLLWDGACNLHEQFSAEGIRELLAAHPDAVLLAHPECSEAVADMADVLASTAGLLKYAVSHPEIKCFVVATEAGILYRMRRQCPDQTFIPAPTATASCGICREMRRNTLENLYRCLLDMQPRVSIDPVLAARAAEPIRRMLEISARLGL